MDQGLPLGRGQPFRGRQCSMFGNQVVPAGGAFHGLFQKNSFRTNDVLRRVKVTTIVISQVDEIAEGEPDRPKNPVD